MCFGSTQELYFRTILGAEYYFQRYPQAKTQHLWDRSSLSTGRGDPGRVLGAFTVDGFDERRQAFADAARQLRDETDWE